jgi:hypothetical protein
MVRNGLCGFYFVERCASETCRICPGFCDSLNIGMRRAETPVMSLSNLGDHEARLSRSDNSASYCEVTGLHFVPIEIPVPGVHRSLWTDRSCLDLAAEREKD